MQTEIYKLTDRKKQNICFGAEIWVYNMSIDKFSKAGVYIWCYLVKKYRQIKWRVSTNCCSHPFSKTIRVHGSFKKKKKLLHTFLFIAFQFALKLDAVNNENSELSFKRSWWNLLWSAKNTIPIPTDSYGI